MADVRDYLEMRGDITLEERPFNDVDNVILATLSYLDLKGIVPAPEDDGSVSVSEACEAFLARAEGEDVSAWIRSLASIDARFVRALGASERFGPARLRSYVDVRDEELVLQFSAVCVDLPGGATFVSYRGTDSSLVGWREDFMLSYQVTEAQRAAAVYLESEAAGAVAEGRRLYVGGHSKGGILAAYAAASLPQKYRPLVLRIWSDDGPGMAADAIPSRCVDLFGEKFVHIVPTYSIVGMFFDDGAPKLVVKSSAERASQHDPMSWQVGPQALVLADDLLPECKHMNKALADWVGSMDAAERERFTDEFFDVLEAGGATTLDEVFGSAKAVQKVLQALTDADQRTKNLVWELVGAAIGANVSAAGEAVAGAVEGAIQRAWPRE